MKRWEKLEQAFKTHIEGMSDDDWDNWVNNLEKNSQERFEQAKIESEKHILNYKELKTKFTETLNSISEEKLVKFQNKVIMEQYEQILTDLGFTFQQVNKFGGKDYIRTYTKYIETNIIEVYLVSLVNNSMQVTKHTDGGYGNTAETMQFTINPDTMPVILNSILSL